MANRESEQEKQSRLDPVPRSRLHNFTFLTSSWGAQRVMRRADSRHAVAGGSQDQSTEAASDKVNSPVKSPQKEQSLPREELSEKKKPLKESPEKEKSPEDEDNLEIPWNLRKRRAYVKGDSSNGVVNVARKEGKRRPFSISLSYEEIEADFLMMKGKKPPRRPKKRPKHVQKQIDMCFPGTWLSEVTPDLYKVKEE